MWKPLGVEYSAKPIAVITFSMCQILFCLSFKTFVLVELFNSLARIHIQAIHFTVFVTRIRFWETR